MRRECEPASFPHCAQHLSAAGEAFVLLAPLNPEPPRVQLVAPSVVYHCDDIEVDARGSSGRAGRPWASVAWTVTGTGNSRLLDITARLQSYGASTSVSCALCTTAAIMCCCRPAVCRVVHSVLGGAVPERLWADRLSPLSRLLHLLLQRGGVHLLQRYYAAYRIPHCAAQHLIARGLLSHS